VVIRGVAEGGSCMATPGGTVQGVAKRILKKNYFLCSTDFKLLREINRNSLNNCNFLKFIVSVRLATVITHPGCQKT
jgi:hypothetical protein